MIEDPQWQALHDAAASAAEQAYVPYSRFPVGVAALVEDGRIVTGCNVENASYGVGLCAECGLISQLALTGGGRLVAVSCVDAKGDPLAPCGRCRQLLWEHRADGCQVWTAAGPVSLESLLPGAFDRRDLERSPDASRPR